MNEFAKALTVWLLPRFGEDLAFKLDLDSLPALEGLREKRFNRAALAYEKGVMTRQESRAMLGLPPDGDGDFAPTFEQKGLEQKKSFKPTDGMVSNYRRGLKLHEDGKTGDGIEAATISMARKIVGGGSVVPVANRAAVASASVGAGAG